MDAESSVADGKGRRKRKSGPNSNSSSSSSSGRKKQKMLDAIQDRPSPSTPAKGAVVESDDDEAFPRRSSRMRKTPMILDSSPVPSGRKRSNVGSGPPGVSPRGKKIVKDVGRRRRKKKGKKLVKKAINFVDQSGEVEDGSGEWGSRLRATGRGKSVRRRGTVTSSPIRRAKSTLNSDDTCLQEKQEAEVPSDSFAKDAAGKSVSEAPQSTSGVLPSSPVTKGERSVQHEDKNLQERQEVEFHLKQLVEEAGVSATGTPQSRRGRKRKKRKVKKTVVKQVKTSPLSPKSSSVLEGVKDANFEKSEKEGDMDKEGKRGTCELTKDENLDVIVMHKEDDVAKEACNEEFGSDRLSNYEEINAMAELPVIQDIENRDVLEKTEEGEQEQVTVKCKDGNANSPCHTVGERNAEFSHELNDTCLHNGTGTTNSKLGTRKNAEINAVQDEAYLNDAAVSDIPIGQEGRESRRCGLCGRGSDGKPSKRLVHESADSDNEACNGPSASEEPKYDFLDGFGDEPEWLGHLLGPIRDRFGITRIWVHQHCAVWSPEVYFAGLGCLKNVRAALSRGRVLKCCRCGRPGATIGCRVDRCPKTYHLPCARADGCIFDHHKFLIACLDHRHLFQPQGNLYLQHVKKLKAKKLKLDMRKLSNEASRKDLETEEKWLENCGEDEEFLKRESRRLHRDVIRIAPIYIGGLSSENKNIFPGWESVAGLQDVIQCMKEVVILPLLYPDIFCSMGLTPPRGVLLHGYPGTGKTMIVRSLIGECSRGNKRIAYFARKGADCLGKYVGDAERQLRLLFQAAEKVQPSIVFFDEIDGLAPCRSRRQDQTHNSVVSTLLSLLDGLKSRGSVIVIGATNRPDAVDPALRRPGRFDREIYFPLPSLKDRHAILSLHTKSWPEPLPEPTLSWIAKETVGYAGADLQALCTQAAIIALRRNCPLNAILLSAEKGIGSGGRPSLPSIVVKEGDWLAALACSPPPCSRREAGIAANDVASSPLQSHLLPCLLHYLSQLLISLYLDDRIWLPPSLFKASKCVKNIVFSQMEKKNIPHVSWMSHLLSLIQEPDVVPEIERSLSHSGLLIGQSIYSDGYDESDSYRVKLESCRNSDLMQKSLGFRLLIAGTPRSGQNHLASCLMHGFTGDIEIQKINLATISQEGNGDIIRGVTQILLRCRSLKRCLLYVPRIDLWALEELHKPNVEAIVSDRHTLSEDTIKSSRAWDLFVEQVNSVCASSLIILATSEVQLHDLPLEVRKLFAGGSLKTSFSAFSNHTVPCFSLQIDGKFDHNLMVDLYSAKLSQDLIQQYVQKLHEKIHVSIMPENFKANDVKEDDSGAHNLNYQTTEATKLIDSERIYCNTGASCKAEENNEHTTCVKDYANIHSQELVPSKFPQNKAIKGNAMLAIASFGYQVLRFPHFAELCWATSRLKEGPCVDLSASWKVWPFNSCVVRPNSSPSKNCKESKNIVVRGLIAVGLLAYRGGYTSVREVSLQVREVLELIVADIAAKILGGKNRYRFHRILSQIAYLEDVISSWVYSLQSLQVEGSLYGHIDQKQAMPDNQGIISLQSDKEVCLPDSGKDLCGHIDPKQVMPDSHGIISLQSDKEVCLPNSGKDSRGHEIIEVSCSSLPETNNADPIVQPSSLVAGNEPLQAMVDSMHIDQKQVMLDNQGIINLQSDKEVCLPNSGKDSSGQEIKETSCSPLPGIDNAGLIVQPSSLVAEDEPMLHLNSSIACEPAAPEESGRLEDVVTCPQTKFETADISNSFQATKSCTPIQDLSIIPVGVDVGKSDKPIGITDSPVKNNGFISDSSTTSKTSCIYQCCSHCQHIIHTLTHKILMECWKSRECFSRVDDVHDILASCSARLLASTSAYYACQSGNTIEEDTNKEHESCTGECSCLGIEDILQCETSTSSHSKHLNRKILSTIECTYHPEAAEIDVAVLEDACRQCKPTLKRFFRNNTMVSSISSEETNLHCNYNKLCLCSVVEGILASKHPVS